MNYSNIPIKDHKISYIKDVSNIIDSDIPHFSHAWLEIGKYMNKDKSRWLRKLNPLFEGLGTGHYTILKSLNYIRLSKCISNSYMNDSNQRFKNIFFHFGVILDCSHQIARDIVLIKSKLNLIEYEESYYPLEKIKLKLESWYNSNENGYKRKLEELVLYGIPIDYIIQPERDIYFKTLDKEKKYTKEYFKFRNAVQSYRNAYIHNPMIDVFIHRGVECVIDTNANKSGMIKLNQYRYLSQLDDLDEKHFIHPQALIERNYRLLLNGLNSLWNLFSNELHVINSSDNLETVLYRFENE